MAKTKFQIFLFVLQLVANITEIDSDIILSKCRTAEVVDARYLIIYAMSHILGFNAAYIAEQLGMTPQGVRQVITRFDSRRQQAGKIFEISLHQIRNSLESI